MNVQVQGFDASTGGGTQFGFEGPAHAYRSCGDRDADGVIDYEDNCPLVANTDQADADSNGVGDVCDTDGGCTYSQGYWKNHNRHAKQDHKQTPWPIDEDTVLCGETWHDILHTPTKGNAWYILARQAVAAALNGANGASVPPEIEAAGAEAKDLLESCEEDAGDRQRATALADLLESYNVGDIGPGYCVEDEPLSSDGPACSSVAPSRSVPVSGFLLSMLAFVFVLRRRRVRS